ncbi:MAG: DUF2948 family protein [Pseudomonadota bacterium]
MAEPTPLRLLAEDGDDLKIVAAAVRDSVTKAANLKFSQRARRFTLEINRFRWEIGEQRGRPGQRVRAILSVDEVLGVSARGINKLDPELVVSLLDIHYEPNSEPPGGVLTLAFAGDGDIRLVVDALDVTLLDSDYVWPTRKTPSHDRRRR